MEPKKNPKLDTSKQLPVFIMVGFVFALAIVISAFEWSHTVITEGEAFDVFVLPPGDEILDIPMTVQNLPPPAVVAQEPILIEVPNEVEIKENVKINNEEKPVISTDNHTTDVLPKKEFKGRPTLPPPTAVIVDNAIREYVDEQPEFLGGEEAFMKYVKSKLVYPRLAKTRNIQGKVFVSFVVEKDGSLTDIKLVRGIGGGCDEAAINVVKNCPKWKPGKQHFKAVRVRMALPIFFKLKK